LRGGGNRLSSNRKGFTLAEDAKRLSLLKDIRHRAFTLAEVLVTLGIIGVVAAMTIPSMINKTHNKELHAQYKKVYAELNQISQLFMKDNGLSATDFCQTYGTPDFVKTQLPKYFKGVTLIDDTSHGSTDDEGNKKSNAYPMYTLNGTKITLGTCDDLGFRTESGGRVFSFVGDAIKDEEQGPVVCVDINGQKRPNKWGYDIFIFRFTRNGYVLPMGQEYNGAEENYGYSGDRASSNFFIKNQCKYTSNVSNQVSCSYYALADKHPTIEGKNYWQDFLGTSK